MELHRWAGVSALTAVVLFAIANALWAFEQPAPDAPARDVITFYTEASDRIVVGAPLSLFSMAVFVVFVVALRRIVSGPLGDLAFAGALLGLAAGLGAETVNMAAALRAGDGALTEPLALALFDVSYVFGSFGVGIGFGLFALAVSAASLRGLPLLPRWLAFAGLAVGVALVTPLAGFAIGEYTIAPAFVLVASIGARLLRGAGREATTVVRPTRSEAV